jgi:dCMP deaminase
VSSEQAVVAYIPVLHDGYRRFLAAHAAERRLFVVGRELHFEDRSLAKDIRALDAELVAAAVAAWGVCAEVGVLDVAGAERLAGEGVEITLPAEDVSYRIVERFFARCAVRYDTVFLRWDKTRSAQLLVPGAARRVSVSPRAAGARGAGAGGGAGASGEDALLAQLAAAAEEQAGESIDWWRRVGAAIRFADGSLAATCNEHLPHRLSAYAAGDPRASFFKGVHLELGTAVHAEARLIAAAAREGRSTDGAVLYVTDFPCPPCAKLIAGAGVARLYFQAGYAVLDGQDVLAAAGVEVVQVQVDDGAGGG